MKNNFSKFIKIFIPLALGIVLVWWMFKDMTENDKEELLNSFQNANYFWVVVSVVGGMLSHASRAWRWKYTLRPLGYEMKFANGFYTVMIGYCANLLIPRMGEVSRCAYLAKYSGIPFNKLLGTVIAERVVDFILLFSFIILVVFIQFEKLGHLFYDSSVYKQLSNPAGMIGLLVGISVLAGGFIYVLKKSNHPFVFKVKEFVLGLVTGVKSIMHMKDKWPFLFHTFIIWGLYILMFYVAFLSIPGISNVPFSGIVSAFVVGGISIAATNGGLGAYPASIMGILFLYEVPRNTGLAFGWIMWSSQTIMIIILGLASVILITVYNRKPRVEHAK